MNASAIVIALVALACTGARPEPARPAVLAGVIERIETHGNTYTRAKTIRSVLSIREGEPFAPADIDAARRQLEALDLQQVTIAVRRGSSLGLVLVEVHVTERPRTHAGFSSLDTFIAGPGMRQAPPD